MNVKKQQKNRSYKSTGYSYLKNGINATSDKRKNSWTTKEVQKLIEEEIGVKYSSYYVRRILSSL